MVHVPSGAHVSLSLHRAVRPLASLIVRRPRAVVAIVLLATIAAAFVGRGTGERLSGGDDNFDDPAVEAIATRDALEAQAGVRLSPDVLVVARPGAGDRQAAREAARELCREPTVGMVRVERAGEPGRRVWVAAATYRDVDGEAAEAATVRVLERLGGDPRLAVGGPAVAGEQTRDQVSSDLLRAEIVALPLLFLLSVAVFGGVRAALLPIAVGIVTVAGTLALLRAVAGVVDVSAFALNIVTGLGLGLAIDYSLFVVTRFRDELARPGAQIADAVAATMVTAGRTVVFSALTVALALASLIVFPQRFLYSMGIGGALVALAAAAIVLVLLPALLSLGGSRLASRRAAAAVNRRAARWRRVASAVTRRPGLVAAACCAVLAAGALPAAGVTFGGNDARILPTDLSSRQAADLLAGAGATSDGPAVVVLRGADARQAAAFGAEIARLDGARAVEAPRPGPSGSYLIDVLPRAPAIDEEARRLVAGIRALPVDAGSVAVTGPAASFHDNQASLADRLPLALALLAAGTVLVLFALSGSVLVPLLAIVMNAATLAVTFGALVLVFQDGRLESLLGYTSTGSLQAANMTVLFVLAFALSTDYGIFLLARIREARDTGAAARDAVVEGVARTGYPITAAALLFCVAIGAFATSEIVFIKQLGLGTALAVLVDATLVRTLLAPALLTALGDRVWWAPRPLRALHDRFGWREPPSAPPSPTPAT